MKKMLFLMLFLIILGAANVSAQVRIGGNGQPNTAAVLDLNATDAINNGTKTLALPRVSLASTTDNLSNATLLNGMLVYNTNTTSGAGVYYWDTNKWVKVSDGAFTEGDGVIGNEVANATANGGLERSGAGTESAPYTLGLPTSGVRTGDVPKYDGSQWVASGKIDTVFSIALDTFAVKPVGSYMIIPRTQWGSYDMTKCVYLPANRLIGTSVGLVAAGLYLFKDSEHFAGSSGSLYTFCFRP